MSGAAGLETGHATRSRRHAQRSESAGRHRGAPTPQKGSTPGPNRRRFVTPLMALAAVVLWWTQLGNVAVTPLTGVGLIAALPPLMLISYVLLTASAVAELVRRDGRAQVLAMITGSAVLMIYGLQPAVQGVARLPVGWLHVGFANHIGNTGETMSNFDTRFSWPGFFAFVSFVGRAAGQADVSAMLNWAPVVLAGLAVLAMRALAGAVFGDDRKSWIATWLLMLANWTEQDYFSPQGTAFVLYLAALAVTVNYLVRPGVISGTKVARSARLVPMTSARERILAQAGVLLIALALAPTHQLTPFVLTGMLIVLAVWRRLWPTWLPVMVGLCAVVWFVLGGREFWSGQLALITSSIGDLDSSINAGIGARLGGDPGHEMVVLIRIGLTCTVAVLALAGWLVERRRGGSAWLLPTLGVSAFGLAVLQPYGGEVFMRCFLFALPWFAIGGALALDALLGGGSASRWRRAVSTIVLFGILLATVVSRGGNDAYTAVTQADVNAIHYVYRNANPGEAVVALLWYSPLRADRVGDLRQVSAAELETGQTRCRTESEILACVRDAAPAFVMINPQQEAAGVIVSGMSAGWTDRIAESLVTAGYTVTFDQHGSKVLTRVDSEGGR